MSFLYSYIGIMIGSLLAFGLGKWLGRRYVNWIVGSKEKVDEWLEKFKGKSNVILFFMFLLPGFPDDLLCSLAGVTSLGWSGFTLMQLPCRAVAIGATLLLLSGEVIPYHGWGIAVLTVIALLAIVAFAVSFKYADRINDFFYHTMDQICGKRKRKSACLPKTETVDTASAPHDYDKTKTDENIAPKGDPPDKS